MYVGEHTEAQGKPGFLAAKKTFGDWQMYPRNAEVVPLLRDGRWKIEPNPVDWTIMPKLAAPVCMRRDTTNGLTAILMAPPADCFTVATPHEGETHYSLYLSLFGRDIKAGETIKARTRLILTGVLSDEQILALYEHYLSERPGLIQQP